MSRFTGTGRERSAGPRVPVDAMRLEDAPVAWQPSLRLVFWLAQLFPDQTIDIEEVPFTPADSEE